jgi:hypothetical protein
MKRRRLAICFVLAALLDEMPGLAAQPSAVSRDVSQVAIGIDDIGGVVGSSSGPEAGVWVIAETSDLGTRFAKIVVTDDGGRYVIPDLPKASYKVWVRGYGLVDSPKVDAVPGRIVDLTAAVAPPPSKRPLLRVLGPGLISGASDDDPSGIATYSQAGAQLGYAITWTMLFGYPLMTVIQEISARIGRTTGKGIAGNICQHYPNWLLQAT